MASRGQGAAPAGSSLATCSICGRGGDASAKVVAGRSFAICSRCLRDAAALWKGEELPDAPLARTRVGAHLDLDGPLCCEFCGEDAAPLGFALTVPDAARRVHICGACALLGLEMGSVKRRN